MSGKHKGLKGKILINIKHIITHTDDIDNIIKDVNHELNTLKFLQELDSMVIKQ